MMDSIDLQEIPLMALRLKCRNSLSIYLDSIKVLPSSDGLCRDWRGVFYLSGLANQYESFLSSKSSPTGELIKILEKEPHHTTMAAFLKILGDIDRWDVVDDTREMFLEDAIEHLKNKEKYDRYKDQLAEIPKSKIKADENILTRHDVVLAENNLPLQQYDAFVLFADNDIDFATEMIEKVEEFGFQVCAKERDFLAGLSFEHDAIRRLLTERCDRLIVILSPDFVESSLNEYISNLAQSLGIAQRKRKIIPCLYKPCKLPEIFHHVHLLDYEKSRKFFNFWEKLRSSLQSTPEELTANKSQIRITITDAEQPKLAPPPVTPVQQIDNLLNIAAPTRQRKRNNNKIPEAKSLPSTPPTPTSVPVTPDSNKKFWPPQPKLRAATSMVNLTDLDLTESNNNNSFNVERQTKKPRWYNKLSHTLKLTPQNLSLSGTDLNSTKEKKNKKTIWRRMKLVTHN